MIRYYFQFSSRNSLELNYLWACLTNLHCKCLELFSVAVCQVPNHLLRLLICNLPHHPRFPRFFSTKFNVLCFGASSWSLDVFDAQQFSCLFWFWFYKFSLQLFFSIITGLRRQAMYASYYYFSFFPILFPKQNGCAVFCC